MRPSPDDLQDLAEFHERVKALHDTVYDLRYPEGKDKLPLPFGRVPGQIAVLDALSAVDAALRSLDATTVAFADSCGLDLVDVGVGTRARRRREAKAQEAVPILHAVG